MSYTPLDRKANWHCKKQYQGLDKVYENDKKEEEKTKDRKRVQSNLFYSNTFTFLKYSNIEKFANLSFTSKRKDLKDFKTKLELFNNKTEWIKPTNKDQENDFEKGNVVLNTASNVYNSLLKIYSDQFNKLKPNKKIENKNTHLKAWILKNIIIMKANFWKMKMNNQMIKH